MTPRRSFLSTMPLRICHTAHMIRRAHLRRGNHLQRNPPRGTPRSTVEEPLTPSSNDAETADDTPLFVGHDSEGEPAATEAGVHTDNAAEQKRKFRVFEDVTEFSEFSDAGSESDADLDDLFASKPPAKRSSPSRPRKESKPRGPLAKTAREWHKNRQERLRQRNPDRLSASTLKRKQIQNLRERFKNGPPKKKAARTPKQNSAGRLDPRIFLYGGTGANRADNTSDARDSDRVFDEHTGSNKTNFWTKFMELNEGNGLNWLPQMFVGLEQSGQGKQNIWTQ